jgi:hypothetical protein
VDTGSREENALDESHGAASDFVRSGRLQEITTWIEAFENVIAGMGFRIKPHA